MSETASQPLTLVQAPVKSKDSSRILTRVSVIGAVGLVSVAALAVGVRWGYYRYQNIVLAEAAIKGTITKVGARIDGRIRSIEVEPGDQVTKGQVLLRLEDRHLKAALDRSNAELRSAIEDLETEKMSIEQTRRKLTLEVGRLDGLRKKVQGDLQAQESSLVRLQKQYDRIALLLKSGAASVAEMDKITGDRDRAEAYVTSAQGQVEAAESNYEKATTELEGLTIREARLKVLESNVAMARSKVEEAEADLDAAVIRAPEDGRVLERIVEVGGSARVGEPMLALWIGRPYVEAWADERDLARFKIGSRAEVALDTAGRPRLAGRVESVGLASDKQLQAGSVPTTLHALVRRNAMVPVRIALDSDSSEVQLGLSAVVGIQKEPAATDTVARKVPAIAGTWGQPRGQ